MMFIHSKQSILTENAKRIKIMMVFVPHITVKMNKNYLFHNLSRREIPEAGATFDNTFFDNSFIFLRQFKNRSFLDSVFVHVTGRSHN